MADHVRNAWYVAATAGELRPGVPLARTLLGEPMVLFRGSDGKPAALNDRCPHRKYALSRGQVIDGEIECGYHGARFAASGACTLIPGQDHIPGRFGARCYRVEERHRLVWLWGGDPATADAAQIPSEWSINEDPAWRPVFGYHYVRGNYQLVLDNILDLTHVAYVHKSTLNSPQVTQAPLEVEIGEDTIRTLRITRGADCPPLFKRARADLGDKIDRWQKSQFFMPSLLLGDMRGYPAGVEDPSRALRYCVLNGLTPETETTTHYFWSVVRCFALEDDAVDAVLRDGIVQAFNEDCDVVGLQQQMISSDTSGTPPGSFVADRAGAAARRMIRQRVEREQDSPVSRAAIQVAHNTGG
jgi:phenylpropionate dioxygenase-like ring-hydroxylating dioxygenase large terminal subunit